MIEGSVKKVFLPIAVILTLCAVGIAVLISRFGDEIEQLMAQKFNEEQLLLARHITNHLQGDFEDVYEALNSFTDETKAVELAGRLAAKETGDLGDMEELVDKTVAKLFEHNRRYLRFAVTDLSGNPAVYVENMDGVVNKVHIGPPAASPKKVILRDVPILSEPGIKVSKPRALELGAGEDTAVVEAMDIFTTLVHAGEQVGFVVVSVDVKIFHDVLTMASPGKRSNHRWIFDENGALVYCTLNRSQTHHDSEIKQLMASVPGRYELETHPGGGKDLLSSASLQMGQKRWTLVVETEFEEVTRLVRRLNRIRTIVVSALMMMALLGGFFLYRFLVARALVVKTGQLMEEVLGSERKYRSLFEQALDPIFLLNSDRNIVDLNSAALKAFRLPKEVMAGRPLEEFIPDREKFLTVMKSLAEKGGSETWEHTVKDSEGNELYFKNTTSALKAADGKEGRYQTYMHNLTDRKKYEVKLQQEKDNLDRIVSSVGGGLALYDKDSRLRWLNSQYTTFFKGKNLKIGEVCSTIGCNLPEGSEDFCPVAKTLATGESQKLEVRYTRAEGYEKNLLVTTTPIRDSRGKIEGVMELVIDITESRKIEQQLAHREKLASIGELAAGIAHELNNPMTGIIGNSEFLIDELADEELKKDAERINRDALRCSRIISNLLTFARAHQPQRNSLNLNETVDAALEIVDQEYKVKNINVERNYDSKLNAIMGNQNELQQVFLNIFNNACHYLKAIDRPRNVWITSGNLDGSVFVSIENNGPKIKDADMERIFEPFFTTKDFGEGTGLGLSVSHGIVKSHNGEMFVANSERGVSFRIQFRTGGAG